MDESGAARYTGAYAYANSDSGAVSHVNPDRYADARPYTNAGAYPYPDADAAVID